MKNRDEMIADARLAGKEYGVFFSPAGKPVFSAERIQRAVAVFDSRPVVISSEITSWKSLSWSAVVPALANLYVYARTANSEETLSQSEWHGPMVGGVGDISKETGKVLQFRIAMVSEYNAADQDIPTPEVTSLDASCNIRGVSQAFYTATIPVGFVPKHVIVTYNGTIPDDAIIEFAVSASGSTKQVKYKTITANVVTSLEEIADEKYLKLAISAVGNTEVPFVVNEFAIAVSGDGFSPIKK